MMNQKKLEMVATVIAGVVGMSAWYDSCKTCASIKDDDGTSVAIRKATDSITYGILCGCCIKVIWGLYNK